MERYEGGCHCGALRYSFRSAVPPSAWSVRACRCSFCRAHGVRSTSDPAGSIGLRVARPERLVRYLFGQRTAPFLLCGACGVFVAALLTTQRGRFATLNLNSLAAPPFDLPPAQPVSYEDESRDERITRREMNWTPVTSGAL